ncbi:hypothetical protein Tco_1035975 [Tanacetum coccineum]
MNQEQIQEATHDEALVSTDDKVKIGTSNMRIDPLLTQKEETYQVILDIIKNSSCYNAFLIIADVPEIYMQQFWFTFKKDKKSSFYHFDLHDTKFQVEVELFQKILRICPRVPDEEFIVPPTRFTDEALKLGKSINRIEAKIAKEERRVHETHERLVTEQTEIVRKEHLAADTKKAIKASKKANQLQKQSRGSSEGASTIPKVPDEPKVKSKGSNEGAETVDDKDVIEGEIEWVSSDDEEVHDDDEAHIEETDDVEETDDDEEEDNDDEEKQDNDKSIDIEETDDERTESDNDDQVMDDAEMNDAEKAKEEKDVDKR